MKPYNIPAIVLMMTMILQKVAVFFTPITLRVTPNEPIYTDPGATVAWSGGLSPTMKADIDFKTLLGKDSGETFQMKFQGDGFVIVQPFEEI